MAFKLSVLVLLLAVAMATVVAQRRRLNPKVSDEWNYRDGCEYSDYSGKKVERNQLAYIHRSMIYLTQIQRTCSVTDYKRLQEHFQDKRTR